MPADNSGRDAQLRMEAEARLANNPVPRPLACRVKELLHELQVHQVELKMQNEALQDAQIALEESRDHFVDFYEFAPVGYLTLTDTGLIAGINLTGSALLCITREKLLQQRFSQFVIPENVDLWHSHFVNSLKRGEKLSCDLALRRGDGALLHVRIDSLRLDKDGHNPSVRVVLTDVSDRKLTFPRKS